MDSSQKEKEKGKKKKIFLIPRACPYQQNVGNRVDMLFVRSNLYNTTVRTSAMTNSPPF